MDRFDPDRYSRQTRFAPLGPAGQEKLASARVAVLGCGALGAVSALALARAGVGFLRLIDRDVPEPSNLPRQPLFDEADVAAGLPKAVAAARHLTRINSALMIEPVVADLTASNAVGLLGGVDVIVDGTDNLEARYLANEVACRTGIPWVHGGAIGAEGRVLTVIPGRTACLRCVVPEALVVGAVQATEAIKLLVGAAEATAGRMLACDLWSFQWRVVDLAPLAAVGCPTCRSGDTPWLDGRQGAAATALCGRDAVQVAAAGESRVDLPALAARLAGVATVSANQWLLRAEVEPGIRLSVFADGRAIVEGTSDLARGRAIVARYL
jgi:adenylyltransferase/sulfurtransferase